MFAAYVHMYMYGCLNGFAHAAMCQYCIALLGFGYMSRIPPQFSVHFQYTKFYADLDLEDYSGDPGRKKDTHTRRIHNSIQKRKKYSK